MPATFLENLYFGLHGDDRDNDEICFYWDKLFDVVEKHVDPKYDLTSFSNHVYNIIAGFGHAERMQGFKRGITFAMKLTTETSYTPDMDRSDVEQEYRRYESPVELATAPTNNPTPAPSQTPSVVKDATAAHLERTRDYLDQAMFQVMRIGEAAAILEETLNYELCESENDRRQIFKLLSAALDIQRQAIPETERIIIEALKPPAQSESPQHHRPESKV
jgi:hypothetical protein